MVAVRARFHHFLVGHDLVGNHEVVDVVDVGCLVVNFGSDCHFSVDDYEGDLVVVKSIL